MGRSMLRPYREASSVAADETVVEAEAEIAAKRGETDGVLVLLVEEISDAASEGHAAGNEIAGGEIEPRVAGIVSQAEAQEIAVGADAGEVASEIQIPMAIGGVEDEAARVDGTAKKMVAGHLNGIEGVGGLRDARVAMRAVPVDADPAAEAQFAGEIDAARAGKIGDEIRAGTLLTGSSHCWIESEANDIAEAIVEVSSGETETLAGEELVETNLIGLATLGAKSGIAGEARVAAEGLFKGRLLETLAVGEARAEVTPEAAAIVKSVHGTCAGDDASTESSVGFGACAGAEGEAGGGLPARAAKGGLLGAAGA